MHILLTNDDGIGAPGLQILESIARDLPKFRSLTIVAPAQEQSGVSHAITYKRPLDFRQDDTNHFAVNGTPADCVLVAIGQICQTRPDLILSGVNDGNNAAQNTLYSGTVGAAIEGAFQGIPSIALSQFYGSDTAPNNPFEVAKAYASEVITKIIENDLWVMNDIPLHYNVNFPPIRAAQVKGMRYTRQGARPDAPFFATTKGNEIWLSGAVQAVSAPLDTDLGANGAGYIAITPCGVDLTQYNALATLRKREG